MDKYSLRYLPLFYEDLSEIIDYISLKLNNPSAALNLIDYKIDERVVDLLQIVKSMKSKETPNDNN